MEEARRVLERLARIDALERQSVGSHVVLGELKELVREAEAWVRAEPEPDGAVDALERCRTALEAEKREEVTLLAR